MDLERQKCAQFAYDQRSCDEMSKTDLQAYALACGLKPYQNKGKLYSQLSKLNKMIETNKGQNDLLAHALRKFRDTCMAVQQNQTGTNNPEAAWKGLTAIELKEIAKSLLIKDYSSNQIDRMLKHELVKLLYGLMCGSTSTIGVSVGSGGGVSVGTQTQAPFVQPQQPPIQSPSIVVSPTFHMPQMQPQFQPCPSQDTSLLPMLNAQLDTLRQEIQTLKRQLQDCVDEKARLQTLHTQDQAFIEQLKRNLKDCEDQFRPREQDTKHVATTTVTIQEEKITKLTQELLGKEQDVRQRDGRVKDLEAQLATALNDLRSQGNLRFSLDEERGKVAGLQQDLASTQQQLAAAQSSRQQVSGTLQRVQSELTKAIQDLRLSRQGSEQLTAEIVRLRDDNAKLRQNQISAQNADVILRTSAEQDVELKRLEDALETKDDDVRRLQSELRRSQNDFKTFKETNLRDVKQGLQENTELQTTLQRRNGEVKQLNEQVADLQDQLRRARTQLTETTIRPQTSSLVQSDLQAQLDQRDLEIARLKHCCNERDEIKAAFQKQLADLQLKYNVMLQRMEANNEELRTERQQKEQQHQQELQRLQEENSARRVAQQQQNTEMITNLDAARKRDQKRFAEERVRMGKRIMQLETTVNKMRSEVKVNCDDCEQELKRCKDIVQQLQRYTQGIFDENKDFQLRIGRLNDRIIELQTQLPQSQLIQGTLQQLLSQNNQLISQMNSQSTNITNINNSLQNIGDMGFAGFSATLQSLANISSTQYQQAQATSYGIGATVYGINLLGQQGMQTQQMIADTKETVMMELEQNRDEIKQNRLEMQPAVTAGMLEAANIYQQQAQPMYPSSIAFTPSTAGYIAFTPTPPTSSASTPLIEDITETSMAVTPASFSVAETTSTSVTPASAFGSATTTPSSGSSTEQKAPLRRRRYPQGEHSGTWEACAEELFAIFPRTNVREVDIQKITDIRRRWIGHLRDCQQGVDTRIQPYEKADLDKFIMKLQSTIGREDAIREGLINFVGTTNPTNDVRFSTDCQVFAKFLNNNVCGRLLKQLLFAQYPSRSR